MIIKGPFIFKWGDNTLLDVSEVSLDYSQDSEDYPTLDGRNYTIRGAKKVSATIQLLKSDIPAIAAILPQYFVPNGGVMSTGETVNNADGAIDFSAMSCDQEVVGNNLDIISCGNPAQVFRLVNTVTELDSVDLDDKVLQMSIIFTGEPAAGEGAIQIFREGTLNVVS